MPRALDVAGKRFGRLLVIEKTKVAGSKNAMWLCRCDCGNDTLAAAGNLGKTKFSCGCFAKEVQANSLNANRLARPNLHGMSRSTEWRSWSALKSRCLNPKNAKFHRYGGRGIKVCGRWLNSFENFVSDMGLKPSRLHTIDRINNDGDYEPGNCHWAVNRTQARNRSTTKKITINGVTLCIREWCETLGIPDWKPGELLRGRGRNRDLPPKFKTVEAAVRFLHQEAKQSA